MNINLYTDLDEGDNYDRMLNALGRECYPSPIIYYDVSIEDIEENSRLYKLKDGKIIELINTPQKNITFFHDINFDNNDYASKMFLEKQNELYSYTIFIGFNNEILKVWENKRDSLDDMFYKFQKEIKNIVIPEIIVDFLYKEEGVKRELFFNILKQYIKNKKIIIKKQNNL